MVCRKCVGACSRGHPCGEGKETGADEEFVCDGVVTGPQLTPSESGQEGWLDLYARSSARP